MPQAQLDIGAKIWLVEGWVGYEFAEYWEAMAGARYQSQDMRASGTVLTIPIDARIAEPNWTDWFVGVRLNTPITDKWSLIARGDVAVAGDSSSSWNAMIMFRRQIGQTMGLHLAYRHFVDDFSETGYAWDITQRGPLIGYSWTF